MFDWILNILGVIADFFSLKFGNKQAKKVLEEDRRWRRKHNR